MPVKLDLRDVIRAQRLLESAGSKGKRDLRRAVVSTQRSTKTETTKALAETYTAGKQKIGKGLKFGAVNLADLSFVITGFKKPFQLQEYKHTANRSGITVQIKKGASKPLEHAFKVKSTSFGGGGKKARIFKRAGRGNPKGGPPFVGRLPIRTLFGPSVADMLRSTDVTERLSKFALNKLSAEIRRFSEAILRG